MNQQEQQQKQGKRTERTAAEGESDSVLFWGYLNVKCLSAEGQNLGLFNRKSILVPLGKVTLGGGVLSRVWGAGREGHTEEKSTPPPDNKVPAPQPGWPQTEKSKTGEGPDRNTVVWQPLPSFHCRAQLWGLALVPYRQQGVPRTPGGEMCVPNQRAEAAAEGSGCPVPHLHSAWKALVIFLLNSEGGQRAQFRPLHCRFRSAPSCREGRMLRAAEAGRQVAATALVQLLVCTGWRCPRQRAGTGGSWRQNQRLENRKGVTSRYWENFWMEALIG